MSASLLQPSVVAAIDAGSIVLARFRGNDVATRAAVAASRTFAIEQSPNRAEESAQEVVDGQTGATMTDFLVATDGLAGMQEFAGHTTGLYYTTDEAHEGSTAFLEKRPPGWATA